MTIDHKSQKDTGKENLVNTGQKNKEIVQLPIKQVKRRFFLLLALAIVLITVLVWLTLSVFDANNIEPFGELVLLFEKYIKV